MAFYEASGTIAVCVSVRIEAGSLEEAQEIALRIADGDYVEGQSEWPGMTNYAGNGGTTRLVGLYGSTGDGWKLEADDVLPKFETENVWKIGESEQDYD